MTTTTTPLAIHAVCVQSSNEYFSVTIYDDCLSVCIRGSANQSTPRNMRLYPNTGTVHHNPGMYI